MRKQKMTPTTKSIDDMYQLFREDRLNLRPDYQRNSVWPPKARAYLIDTVLMDRPIPMLFVALTRDANTNKMKYRVIDGQQRLRAVFGYLENRFGATESRPEEIRGKRFKKLPPEYQDQFMGYSFVVMEMFGYTEAELRDIFARINKYVVRLNLQELRDAQKPGPFKDFVDSVAQDPVWEELSLFSKADKDRKRDKEFLAELIVLLLDGPQDKKGSLDLYYAAAADQFEDTRSIKRTLLEAAKLAHQLTSGQDVNLFRKRPGFYGLMGSLFDLLQDENSKALLKKKIGSARNELGNFAQLVTSLPSSPSEFENQTQLERSSIDMAYRFKESISRQTDNVKPRTSRIEVITNVVKESF
jgi:hypothetical protein